MYTATYAGEVLHDPRDPTRVATGQSAHLSLTEAGTYLFTLPATHPLAGELAVMARAREVVLMEDGEELFRGRVVRMPERGMDGGWSYECEGERAYLNDVTLPPYECGRGGVPTSADGLFAWYVGCYDEKVPEADRFHVGVNDGWRLHPGDDLALSSDERPSAWSEIKSKLVDVYGGYVRVRHENGLRWVDWLSDGTRECAQRIEFGVNMTDFALSMDGGDLFTRIVPWAERGQADTPDEGGEAGDGSELRISKQPAETWVEPGGDASVSVKAAGGTGALSYAWQRASKDSSWGACGDSDGTGWDSATFKPQTLPGADGTRLRCVVTDESGVTATSDEAVLHVVEHPGWFGISGQPDCEMSDGVWKAGDAVADVESERVHGVIEKAVRYEGVADAAALASAALQDVLNARVATTLQVSAVDLHKVDPSVERIALGDFVRATSRPHGYDGYLLCTDIDVNPSDATATYTLGAVYDTLTGDQSERLSALDARLSEQAQAVDGASEEAKEAARQAARAAEAAKDAQDGVTDAREEARQAREDAAKAAEDARKAVEEASKTGQMAVTGTVVEYATSRDPTQPPAGGWSTTAPEYQAGTYVWQRVTVSHGDGGSEVSDPVLVTGNDGNGVTSQVVEYAAGDSDTEPPGGPWVASPPARARGQWLWARTATTFTDGTSSTSYGLSRDGLDAAVVELATTDGAALRNSRGSTSLRATVLMGGERVTDAAGPARVFCDGARLAWASVGPGGVLTSVADSDPHLTEGGFLLRVDAAEVDGQATFACDLEC